MTSGSPAGAHSRAFVCIGASTGGTEAVKTVLQGFPRNMPPILIVQHMPEMFTGAFARRLDGLCAVHVKEAEDGERLQQSTAYIAPGHSHLSVRRVGTQVQCILRRDDPVNRHRPSVDVLFHSAAQEFGAAAVAALLTGMGKDGAAGMLAMRQRGAWTIAQDQASSVVYGMPREAVAMGAACEVLALGAIPLHILRQLGLSLPGAKESGPFGR